MFTLEMYHEEKDEIIPITQNIDFEVFQKVAVIKLSTHKHEISPNHVLRLILPTGEKIISHSKNKTVGFSDIIKVITKK